jgi:HlyD family secretion protein
VARTRITSAESGGAAAGSRRPIRWIALVGAVLIIALAAWAIAREQAGVAAATSRVVRVFRAPALPAGFASGNGRLEATEYDIATKRAGRIASVAVREGDMVEAGQVLARMDVHDLAADLRQAEAQSVQAREDRRRAVAAVAQHEADVHSAVAAIAQRRSDRRRADAAVAQRRSALAKAQATIVQRESELALTRKELYRSQELFDRGLIARQKLDEDLTRVETAQAALAQEYAGGQVAEGALVEAEAQQQMADAALVQQEALRQAAEAALAAARIDVDYREAAIAAAAAHVERIRTDVADSTLTSPIRGRVLYRVAEPGEVLAAGGKVVTVLELSDVYMTIFLPTEEAGRAVIGAEGRIVLDAAPGLAIPAAVSFVAPRAQFTPKEVETRGERDKLMFRVKVRIDPELLARHADRVKTGLPGVAYVRLDGRADWPEHLRATLPR